MHSLNENVEVRYLAAAISAASNTNAATATIDMQGYESALFVTRIVDSTNTGTMTVSVEGGSASDGTGATTITGTTVVATSAADDDLNNKTLETEVYKPADRYLRLRRATGVANGAYGEAYVILRPYRLPAGLGTAAAASGYRAY